MLDTVSGNAPFKIAWRRPCGAISIAIASFGTCLRASSNRTLLKRLLVWYSGEEYWAMSDFHSDSGNELLIHLDDLFFGSLITCKRIGFNTVELPLFDGRVFKLGHVLLSNIWAESEPPIWCTYCGTRCWRRWRLLRKFSRPPALLRTRWCCLRDPKWCSWNRYCDTPRRRRAAVCFWSVRTRVLRNDGVRKQRERLKNHAFNVNITNSGHHAFDEIGLDGSSTSGVSRQYHLFGGEATVGISAP